jgi:arginine decarboxylase
VDVWAIQQLFPIVPLHRLDEEPRESTTLADITCDSDGKIDRFISAGAARNISPYTELGTLWGYYSQSAT